MTSTRGELLRQVMSETGTTQAALSRYSGVHQPSISQFLSGKVELSDAQLDRLLACMGYQLEVVRKPVRLELTHSERRSWALHRQLAAHLDGERLEEWMDTLEKNLERERSSVQGQPHVRNLERWAELVHSRDVVGLRRALVGLDREAIEMREVSPMGGLLGEEERLAVLHEVRRAG